MKSRVPINLRPYQLMCLVCRHAAAHPDQYGQANRLDAILNSIRSNPEQPLQLTCNVDSVYAWQNPGSAEDTPEGALFNVKRDLDILRELGLVPGDTRPALELFSRLILKIPACQGICGYPSNTSPDWTGCRWANSGHYEEGVRRGIAALISPRTAAEKKTGKINSCVELHTANRLRIRPHHLLCMACFHGGRTELVPIEEDNLFEAIDRIRQQPDIPVELIPGPCMICPPCSSYNPRTQWCLGGNGMGLRDEKKDLDTLQRMGLKYGDIRPANELYRLLFERIEATLLICGYGDGRVTSYEWTICPAATEADARGLTAFQRARAIGMAIPGGKTAPRKQEDTA